MDLTFNFANNSFKTQVYNTEGLYTYTIPKGVTTVFILVVGSGGGGGGGFTRASGTAGGGGGGGGTGAISRIIIPRIFLTDSLIVQVASGGGGGAAGVFGTNGSASTVWFNNLISPVTNPDTLSGNTIIITASGGTAGGGATSVAGGIAGSGGNQTFNTSIKMASLGEWTNRVGINGGEGGFPAAGNVLYGGGSIPFSAGRGGGGINAATPGTNRDGGGITGRGFVPDFLNLNAGGGIGVDGMFMMKPFVSLGGCGGGSNNAGSGGNGGKGAPGTGGGGGGAGTSPGLGGSGGKGGDGLVIICCW